MRKARLKRWWGWMHESGSVGRHAFQSPSRTMGSRKRLAADGTNNDQAAGELVRIAHPALLPVLIALEEWTRRCRASNRNRWGGSSCRQDSAHDAAARRLALKVASRAVFEQDVRRAYDGQCVALRHDPRATHVAVLEGASRMTPRELNEALPMCGPHHEAFERHQIYVEPARRTIRLGPEALSSNAGDAGRRAILHATQSKAWEAFRRPRCGWGGAAHPALPTTRREIRLGEGSRKRRGGNPPSSEVGPDRGEGGLADRGRNGCDSGSTSSTGATSECRRATGAKQTFRRNVGIH